MKLWELRLNENYYDYDCCLGFIIRAETEEKARKLAHEHGCVENLYIKNPWLDPKSSMCEELIDNGEEKVILRDFNGNSYVEKWV